MAEPGTYYISTPIYYVNDKPHIGHCYTTVLADAAARFQRLVRGEPLPQTGGLASPPAESVFFLTGNDEHAEKVVTTAREHGLSPMEWADRNAAEFQRAFASMGIAYDDFIRTTQERHKSKVGRYIRELQRRGDVYLGDYEGWYDVNEENYVPENKAKERDYKGENGKPLVRRKEQNYYFRLTKYGPWLKEYIEKTPGFVQPEARKNEVLGRIREGLEDVPISRPITDDPATQFGIRMPDDPSHRIYVWIDALFNYLTAVDTPERRKFWPADVHLIGKEILWFHACIWPAILHALGEDLPRMVYAHSHYIREGRKMSKSLGNFIDLSVIDAYRAKYSTDALRWYLITQGPLGVTDADFTHAKFVEVYNADLANGIGNCASRVANMVGKYFSGQLPDPRSAAPPMLHAITGLLDSLHQRAIEGDFHQSLEMLSQGIVFIRYVDKFINETEPFKLAKQMGTDPTVEARLAWILYWCAETLRIATLLLYPAMPQKMTELWRRWGCAPPSGVPLRQLADWAGPHRLKPGTRLEIGEPLFMRADPAESAPA
jgi:methionyl-tRNA synthetase